jgi:hypothetical protein
MKESTALALLGIVGVLGRYGRAYAQSCAPVVGNPGTYLCAGTTAVGWSNTISTTGDVTVTTAAGFEFDGTNLPYNQAILLPLRTDGDIQVEDAHESLVKTSNQPGSPRRVFDLESTSGAIDLSWSGSITGSTLLQAQSDITVTGGAQSTAALYQKGSEALTVTSVDGDVNISGIRTINADYGGVLSATGNTVTISGIGALLRGYSIVNGVPVWGGGSSSPGTSLGKVANVTSRGGAQLSVGRVDSNDSGLIITAGGPIGVDVYGTGPGTIMTARNAVRAESSGGDIDVTISGDIGDWALNRVYNQGEVAQLFLSATDPQSSGTTSNITVDAQDIQSRDRALVISNSTANGSVHASVGDISTATYGPYNMAGGGMADVTASGDIYLRADNVTVSAARETGYGGGRQVAWGVYAGRDLRLITQGFVNMTSIYQSNGNLIVDSYGQPVFADRYLSVPSTNISASGRSIQVEIQGDSEAPATVLNARARENLEVEITGDVVSRTSRRIGSGLSYNLYAVDLSNLDNGPVLPGPQAPVSRVTIAGDMDSQVGGLRLENEGTGESRISVTGDMHVGKGLSFTDYGDPVNASAINILSAGRVYLDIGTGVDIVSLNGNQVCGGPSEPVCGRAIRFDGVQNLDSANRSLVLTSDGTIHDDLAFLGTISESVTLGANGTVVGDIDMGDGTDTLMITTGPGSAAGGIEARQGRTTTGGAGQDRLILNTARSTTIENGAFTGFETVDLNLTVGATGTIRLDDPLFSGVFRSDQGAANTDVTLHRGTLAGNGSVSGMLSAFGNLSPGNSIGTLSTSAGLLLDGGGSFTGQSDPTGVVRIEYQVPGLPTYLPTGRGDALFGLNTLHGLNGAPLAPTLAAQDADLLHTAAAATVTAGAGLVLVPRGAAATFEAALADPANTAGEIRWLVLRAEGGGTGALDGIALGEVRLDYEDDQGNLIATGAEATDVTTGWTNVVLVYAGPGGVVDDTPPVGRPGSLAAFSLRPEAVNAGCLPGKVLLFTQDDASNGTCVWMDVGGAAGSSDLDGGGTEDLSEVQIDLGAEMQVGSATETSETRVGVFVGDRSTSLTYDSGASREIDTLRFGAYADLRRDQTDLAFSLIWADHDVETTRFGLLENDLIRGEFEAQTMTFSAEVTGWAYIDPCWDIGMLGGLAWSSGTQEPYSETGSGLENFRFGEQNADALWATVGLKARYRSSGPDHRQTADGSAMPLDLNLLAAMDFLVDGEPAFASSGVYEADRSGTGLWDAGASRWEETAVRLEADLAMKVSDFTTISAGAGGRITDTGLDYAARFSVRVEW